MKIIDSNSEYEKLIKENKLTIIDFYADWCGPCKMLSPIIEEVAHDYEGNDHVAVAKINVDDNNDLAQLNGVQSIPTVIFYKGGQVVGKHVGFMDKETLEEKIKEYI